MRRRLILILIAIAVLLSMTFVSLAGNTPKLDSKSAILIDANTGYVLYEKDADSSREPASMTKMMTAILAVEKLDMEDEVTISKHVTTIGGSAIGLKKNERVKVKDLFGAMLVYSANDCAVALAEAVSGSEKEFAKLMTERANELGCTGTVFKNPNGLHVKGHVSTARDMAIIARKAISYPEIAETVQMTSYKMHKTNKRHAVTVGSTDRLLFDYWSWIKVNGKDRHPYYKYAKGIKTGYTPEAGGCLATYAVKGNEKLISVVMKTTDMKRFSDAIAILEYGFDNFDVVSAVKKGESFGPADVSGGKESNVETKASKSIKLMAEGKDSIKVEEEYDSEIKAPVKEGDKLGVVKVKSGDKVFAEADLLAAASVEESFLAKLFSNKFFVSICMIVITVIALIIVLRIRNKKRKKL